MGDVDGPTVIAAARRWVTAVVVGLNLCPFARRVTEAGRVRYAATDAGDEEELLAALGAELATLVAAPRAEVETTLLIHPRALPAFPDFNDFLAEADRMVRRLGLAGVVQVVGFHPGFRFAGADPDAPENYTNRSPHPMLHLLREESVTEVSGDAAALAEIPRRNTEILRALAREGILARIATNPDEPPR
ncbi:MAG TPA: DUF1415 domain-containing protein [Urbifossiella sp.]|nr:DUF1415 domain-containing protein [Urbifossiella sp.]